jgi:hypothetical protein
MHPMRVISTFWLLAQFAQTLYFTAFQAIWLYEAFLIFGAFY